MTTVELRRTHSQVALPNSASTAQRGSQSIELPARVAFVAAVAAVPPISVLHLTASAQVDPTSWTISDYVVMLPYGIPLFAMTTGALAIGAGVLVRGLAQLAGTKALRLLLAVWATALVALAVFPTNQRGTAENVSSNIHLVAGALVFAVLPAAGLVLARWQRRFTGRSTLT